MDKLLHVILSIIISIISVLYGQKRESEQVLQKQNKATQDSVKRASKAKAKKKTPKDKDKNNRDNKK